MGERTRKPIILLAIYILALGTGFWSGEIYNRMKQKLGVVLVYPETPKPRLFYVVEGKYPNQGFYTVSETDHIIRFYLMKNLRHVLKQRNIKIYNSKGKRIF